MLSIEEIKLLKQKLMRLKGTDWEKFLDEQISILTDLEEATDANNQEQIDRLDKTEQWFRKDNEMKLTNPIVDKMLYQSIQSKIFQFGKTNVYNSLEIGPGNGMFSKEFRAWGQNYFLDILPDVEHRVRKRFRPEHQKYLKFFLTRKTECSNIPQGSCNFVFSWDTFVYFTENHIRHYLHDIKRVLIPGGYCFIQYADCHFDRDLAFAKRGYWAYNTKEKMREIIEDEGYKTIELGQFRPGANYAIFMKHGKQNPITYKFFDIKLD